MDGRARKYGEFENDILVIWKRREWNKVNWIIWLISVIRLQFTRRVTGQKSWMQSSVKRGNKKISKRREVDLNEDEIEFIINPVNSVQLKWACLDTFRAIWTHLLKLVFEKVTLKLFSEKMFSKTVTRNLHDVVIVSAARTPMGSFQSALSSFSAPQLGSIAIAEAVKVKLKGFLSHFIKF